jgi:pyruvate,orthophosphate dikinase
VAERYVYAFSEGSAEMRSLLGGKGAGLAEMARLGVPVPDGFTITTAACVATSRSSWRRSRSARACGWAILPRRCS